MARLNRPILYFWPMIRINQLRPRPMIEDGLDPRSQIWNQQQQFQKGTRYLLTAPSGKGKSTLLHLIYGLRSDYEGQIELNDKPIRQLQPDEWSSIRQRQLSIVFQDLRLFPTLSALENILVKSELAQHLDRPQIEAMAEQLGIGHLLNKPSGSLSYGQRQRVAIIRALAQPFDFLLLDEPFSHLDHENIKIASTLLYKALAEQEAGLLLVSLGDDYDLEFDERLIL